MVGYLKILVVALLMVNPAYAAESTGTLKRIAESGRFRIGFVPDAPPMSFIDKDGATVGYSISLCRHVAKEVKKALGLPDLDIEFIPLIAPEDRLRAVESHAVDIECGATTVTLPRRQRVDFSLMTFITGGGVASKIDAALPSVISLGDKEIAVIKGTTTEAALKLFAETNEYEIELHYIATHAEGLNLLERGEVDGYASDRAMLIGQVLRSDDARKFAITRDVFSFEPYGLMIERGDTEFRLVVDRALAKLYRSARIRRHYYDWFGRFGEPMTPIVEAMYEFQAVSDR